MADGFSGGEVGFRYKYLLDVHTSLVGVSALAQESKCLSESETARWLKSDKVERDQRPGLFAYPAQSNFNGRRFPLEWIQLARRHGWYSLLDAASYLTTTPLDYSDASAAPDFTVLSFYKIFGYPDLGAIVVRRDAGHILRQRRYFGGGTRAAVTSDSFHAPRPGLHDALEDGTLPFHTILALDSALNTFSRLYGPFVNISRHAAIVSRLMFTLLSSLRHHNGRRVCQLYSSPSNSGPIIAFNLISADGSPIGFASFEQLSSLRNIALRTGGMCNPGGVEQCLNLQDLEIKRNFEAGKVCGDDMDVVAGKYTGVIRVSFGACSTIEDVTAFVDFIKEFYVEKEPIAVMNGIEPRTTMTIKSVHLCMATLNSHANDRSHQIMPCLFRSAGGTLACNFTRCPIRSRILPYERRKRSGIISKATPKDGFDQALHKSRNKNHVRFVTCLTCPSRNTSRHWPRAGSGQWSPKAP